MERYKEHIAHCFELIEEKLGRGSLKDWETKDFKMLSESIQKDTGTLLSVSTLKRLCGKVGYGSTPNTSTLDALARYIGFEDWRTFVKNGNLPEVREEKEKIKNGVSRYMILLLLLGLVMLSTIILYFNRSKTIYKPDDFAFNGESVTTGLPNSVVFKYDASAASEKAKIEIQQDWDIRKRVVVNKNDSVSTSIYYWPGYFKSKLVVDDSIVKEKDILIPSDDWLGTIETDSLPIYLDKEDYLNENSLSIKSETLKKYGVDPRTARTAVGLYQVRDFGDLYTNDFEITTLLRNEFKSGKSLCQATQVMIMHEDGPISIVLVDIGCISDISLYAFEKQIDGKKTDLAGFGVDFTDFVQLKVASKNQKLDIVVNNKEVFSFTVPEIPKKIIGISIHFEGAGTVQNVNLKNEQGIVYTFEN